MSLNYHIYRFKIFFNETIWLRLAFTMPPKLALWCFIRVHGCTGCAPGDEYKEAYDTFKVKHGIKNM